MSFTGAFNQLITHATAAGTAITPAITDIRGNDPGTPPGDCIGISYDGDVEPVQFPGGRTLGTTQLGEHLTIRTYWRVADREITTSNLLEQNARTLNNTLQNLIEGDHQLGGNCTDLTLDHGLMKWANVDGQWFRMLEIGVTLVFPDDAVIAP